MVVFGNQAWPLLASVAQSPTGVDSSSTIASTGVCWKQAHHTALVACQWPTLRGKEAASMLSCTLITSELCVHVRGAAEQELGDTPSHPTACCCECLWQSLQVHSAEAL